MSRTDYFLRRLLLVVPTFIGITMLCFAITQFVPGGPVDQMMMRMHGMGSGGESVAGGPSSGSASQESMEREREAFRKHFGFDQPLLKRYWKWFWTISSAYRLESRRRFGTAAPSTWCRA